MSTHGTHGELYAVLVSSLQVWVHPRVEGDQVFWEADSDSALTKVPTPQSAAYLALTHSSCATLLQSVHTVSLEQTCKCHFTFWCVLECSPQVTVQITSPSHTLLKQLSFTLVLPSTAGPRCFAGARPERQHCSPDSCHTS